VRVLATHSIRQFPLHFPSRASPCAIRFRKSSKIEGFRPVPKLRMSEVYPYHICLHGVRSTTLPVTHVSLSQIESFTTCLLIYLLYVIYNECETWLGC